MTKSKKIKLRVGDIIQIPLPNGKYAYGHIYKDTGLGIYTKLTDVPNSPPQDDEMLFIVGFNGAVVEAGDWPIIAHRPFNNEESAWPPPFYIKDPLSGRYEIYHKGQIQKSSEEECKDLEKAAVWDSKHVINRIMGSDKWN